MHRNGNYVNSKKSKKLSLILQFQSWELLGDLQTV